MDTLKNKTVLITGASAGIGKALALEFGQKKANLVLFARRKDRLDALSKEIQPSGEKVLCVEGDVRSEELLGKAVTEGTNRFGGIDVVIANAGFGVVGNLTDLTVEDYRRQFEVNVFGLLNTIYASVEELKKSKGVLVLIGSVAGVIGLPGSSPYGMSKAAVNILGFALYEELKAHGVSVLLVAPGFVDSEIRQVDNMGKLHQEQKDPVPRWMRVTAETAAQEIVEAIVKRKRELIITWPGKLAVWIYRHFPWILKAAIGRKKLKARKEPK
ncbi:MAG: SDR family NAD(P)-dependent oxidoreductase [Bdellovibrio sp.]|nr:SDR family NAD(P)-dependent oxidoreductase [Bdellovibrio sp.]